MSQHLRISPMIGASIVALLIVAPSAATAQQSGGVSSAEPAQASPESAPNSATARPSGSVSSAEPAQAGPGPEVVAPGAPPSDSAAHGEAAAADGAGAGERVEPAPVAEPPGAPPPVPSVAAPPPRPPIPAPPPSPPIPAPPPVRSTTAYLHEGVFLRMGLGFGPLRGNTDLPLMPGVSDDADVAGSATSVELLIGGSPVPGLVLGGALMNYSVGEPEVDTATATATADDTNLGFSQIGMFVAYYPDPSSGFNAQAFIGAANATIDQPDFEYDNPRGFAVAAGAGYDFWVGEEWSVGPFLRVMYTKLKSHDAGVDYRMKALAPAIYFVGTFH